MLAASEQSMVGADAVPLSRPRRHELSDRFARHSYGLIRCRQRIRDRAQRNRLDA